MENRETEEESVCLVSFDGGGPGSLSQLRLLDEFMARLAFELDYELDEVRPADYFDVMGGVGFGAFIALLLGRLRMSTSHVMEELSRIGIAIFPKDDEPSNPEVSSTRLRKAVESMLERHGHSSDIKLRDDSISPCKVVVFAATAAVMDHCQAFRTYRSPRRGIDCTFVEAACAVLSIPEFISPISIGPRSREQRFAGIPHGFDNPAREVLKEAQLIFGSKKHVSLVLSLGSGQRVVLSDLNHHVTRLSHIQFNTVARDLSHQLSGFGAYLRLNVDRGMENIQLDDWRELGLIETYTNVYLEMSEITRYIDNACQWLLKRNGSVTLGQLGTPFHWSMMLASDILTLADGTSTDSTIRFRSRTLQDYLAMEFKQMHEVVQQMGIEKITLVDAIGNHIPVPNEFCPTYAMLAAVIEVYFRHQKPPGSDFVERGDYRLVHGSNMNTVGPMEWTRIEKIGLKVELSIILRTRNEDKAKCPRCHTWSQSHAANGWIRCLSCSGQFQIETKVQEQNNTQSEEISHSEDENTGGSNLVTPSVMESRSSSRRQTPERDSRNSRQNQELQFRLISVINLLQPATHFYSFQQIYTLPTNISMNNSNEGYPPDYSQLSSYYGSDSGDSEEDRVSPPTFFDESSASEIALRLSPHRRNLRSGIQDLLQGDLNLEIPDDICTEFNATPDGPEYTCHLVNWNGRCMARFTRLDRLKHHLQAHLGIAPYSCMDSSMPTFEPKCERRFSSVAARDTHVRNKVPVRRAW